MARSFWMRPLAWCFYGVFVVAALWHAPRSVDTTLRRFASPPAATVLEEAQWWRQAWASLPARRNERDASRRWPLDVQVAGPLQPLQQRLRAQGWQAQPQASWTATLGLLDDDKAPAQQPVLPATLDAEAETLLLRRPGRAPDQVEVLRLWRAPARLADDAPLWVGTTQTLHYTQPFGVFGLWQPREDGGAAHAAVRAALAAAPGVQVIEARHPHSGVAVLRVRGR